VQLPTNNGAGAARARPTPSTRVGGHPHTSASTREGDREWRRAGEQLTAAASWQGARGGAAAADEAAGGGGAANLVAFSTAASAPAFKGRARLSFQIKLSRCRSRSF